MKIPQSDRLLEIENQELELNQSIAITSWSFVDGGSTTGINKNTTQNAYEQAMVVWNDQLYSAWREYNGTAYQIRVAKYDGTTWNFVDGDGTNGLNKNPAYEAFLPNLQVHEGQLFTIWHERDEFDIGQIRVAVFDGDTWSLIDGNGTTGLNKVSAQPAEAPKLVSFEGNLYAVWHEKNGSKNQIRVSAYNGVSWSFVDGNGANGINYNSNVNAGKAFPLVWNGQLIIAWQENKIDIGDHIRVASFDGVTWNFIDGGGPDGINKNPSQFGKSPNLISFNSKLYATWYENNGSIYQIRVASYDGTSWSFIDGNGSNGINKNPSEYAYNPKLQVYKNQLYSTWYEHNGTAQQARVAIYDDNSTWTFPGNNGNNGINYDPTTGASYLSLMLFNNRLYVSWNEFNGTADQIRVARGDY